MIKNRFCIFIACLYFSWTVFASDLTENVFLRLYKRNGSYIDENIRNANLLISHMDKNNKIVIFLSGWNEEINSEDVQLITNAYLENTEDNILALDYRNVSTEFYLFAVPDLYKVGKSVAAALDNMIENGINSKNIHIIGHSLGAQLAGIIGRNMNYKIGRITGLDPAGPLYYLLNNHLSISDADFVDVIHTDMGIFGIALKIGHVDFFPNYGSRPQPGCLLSSDDFCSHHRSYKFYAESVKNHNAFIAKCDLLNECNGVEYIPMGYVTPTNATGNYYFSTNSKSPFGRGLTGATFNPLRIMPVL
ncbi:lipase member H-A [Apis mellifera carnica]|uniref:phospholipase A1 n=1 Tax=Apis mellifera TaxID=7460 RepID=A0A7M7MR23_APIME|nr:lipase member H-A [Apis mellifera]KAG9436247.1 lipase member H-A [Apis mellifera carnica]|eukprot:XP_026299638.1 lipase member H-A [Apis mellifera]